MLERILLSIVCMAGLALSGCGYKAHAYITRRERVDQGRPQTFNFNPTATQPPVIEPETPKTRQVIVVEMIKTAKDKNSSSHSSAQDVIPTSSEALGPSSTQSIPPVKENIRKINTPPDFSIQEGQSYTVQKDDTLQKIAKKVYGNYGQWTKIYEANRGQIKDPNFLKAGMILTLP